MKIHDVHITNWQPPGGPFWDEVKERHAEPLIDATMKMTLSWDEYRALIGIKTDEDCIPVLGR